MNDTAPSSPAMTETEARRAGYGRWTDMSRRTREAARTANRQARAAGDYSSTQIRARPLRAVAVAAGAGMLLGALFSRTGR